MDLVVFVLIMLVMWERQIQPNKYVNKLFWYIWKERYLIVWEMIIVEFNPAVEVKEYSQKKDDINWDLLEQ